MDYCEGCKTKECKYTEVNLFFQYIYDCFGKEFGICECPDKTRANYSCDMVLIETTTEEKIYAEIKEVWYGFGDKKDKNIAEEKGQINYSILISEVIEQSGIDKETELNDFVVSISRAQIGSKDVNLFCDKLREFIKITTFEENEYTFVYERNGNDVIISFNRKTDEQMQKFGDELIVGYATENNNTMDSIFDKMTDVDVLKEEIIHNLKNTSQKKFPKEAERKILLNILRLPTGEDIFFNQNIGNMISNLLNDSYESISNANESYLLYYCDDYNEYAWENNEPLINQIGEVLFIIPLISDCMKGKGVA